MNTRFELAGSSEDRIVYVRPVAVSDLPEEVRAQATGMDRIYAVHDADGERLALVKDRAMAFMLAREHNLSAVNVH